jgi:hypothetical protein
MSFISVIVAGVTIVAAQDAPLFIHHLLRYAGTRAPVGSLPASISACLLVAVVKMPMCQCVSCLLSFGLPRSSQVRPISAGITHKNSYS